MTNYLPSHWRPSESILKALEKQGYTREEMRPRFMEWKIKMCGYAQRRDIKGQLNHGETWDSRFQRMITEQEPESSQEFQSKKKRPKRYNAASDPEHNRELNQKLKDIESIDTSSASERLAQIRSILE